MNVASSVLYCTLLGMPILPRYVHNGLIAVVAFGWFANAGSIPIIKQMPRESLKWA